MSDEKKWINEIAAGSESAFRRLYDRYSVKVFNTAISYTKNKEDAEEILQDVFVVIFNTANKFRGDSSVSTWIYRITVNKSLDYVRKKNATKRQGIFMSFHRKDSDELIIEPVDFVHPGVKMENTENATLLFRVIDQLSENQKTAFILTQVEGLSQKKVAEIMNTSRKSVESLLQRAKKNLSKELEKYYPDRGKKG
ncbi:MAG: RNA polymerase sigma factor [Cyclobacteriaceae bacterium]